MSDSACADRGLILHSNFSGNLCSSFQHITTRETQKTLLREESVHIDVGHDVRRLPVWPERGLDVEDVQHGGDGYEERVVREVPSRADPLQGPSV